MKVNTAKILALNPCSNRRDNYLKYHVSFSGTMSEFLDLDNITHTDKLWVYFRMIPRDQVVAVAADLAESVLHLFEERFPTDSRPRNAIMAARSKNLNKYEQRSTAAYAADAAYAAANAADAATYAATYAANAAAYAADAAYAAANAADAAYAATYAADAAANAAGSSEAGQIAIMKRHVIRIQKERKAKKAVLE